MRKNNNLLIFVILLAGCFGAWFAHYQNAAASDYGSSSVPSYAPHDSSVFPAASSAAVGTSAFLPFSGSGILYGVHVPSASSAGFVIFRDTSPVALTSGTVLTMSPIFTATVPVNNGIVQFNPPLRIYTGLSVQFQACDAKSTAWCGTVLYDRLP